MGQKQSVQKKENSAAIGYVPAIQSFLQSKTKDTLDSKKKKVLIIGSGCAGLGAAWHLNRSGVDVTVFEQDSKLGGHANTVNGKNFPNHALDN